MYHNPGVQRVQALTPTSEYNRSMKGTDRQWLARASHRLLRPLVRIMPTHGVAHKDFDAVVRSVYAEVARDSFTPFK